MANDLKDYPNKVFIAHITTGSTEHIPPVRSNASFVNNVD